MRAEFLRRKKQRGYHVENESCGSLAAVTVAMADRLGFGTERLSSAEELHRAADHGRDD